MHVYGEKCLVEGKGMEQILLVEDDKVLSNGIVLALEEKTYKFYQAYSIQMAKQIWKRETISCIILDINLPDGNGYDFLKLVRKKSHVPILMLTANDLEMDEVMGFKLGADDYMTKPFSLMVLRARMEHLLRCGKEEKNMTYVVDNFSFDFDEMLFKRGKEELNFSKTEQKLLKLLVLNQGITLSREVLIDRLWSDGGDYVDENALSVLIRRLREKLEEQPSKPAYIKTVYGIGYVWRESH